MLENKWREMKIISRKGNERIINIAVRNTNRMFSNDRFSIPFEMAGFSNFECGKTEGLG